ncbi:recombinase family protein [Ahrensia kielensis]|uniref:Recombinase family protein n=1 Tax=Ahrensia kielensis TaxID=76980 RepID=A0ABU9TAE3_9HYPH
MKRVAIYARYSSDLQSPLSIEDQLSMCMSYVNKKDGWSVSYKFTDHAISGASAGNRPQYQQLMEAIERRQVDIILAEDVDRFSREMSDAQRLYSICKSHRIEVHTVKDGELNRVMATFRGLGAAETLENIALKTKRGLTGNIQRGESAGGKSYGIDIAFQHDEKGKRIGGIESINSQEAGIIREIMERYAEGQSALTIAKQLNQRQIPSPTGGKWSFSTILGNPKRGTGILNNELYIGKRVWNRQSYNKNIVTGRRMAFPNPESEWLHADMPELRIVSDELWAAVKKRQQQSSLAVKDAQSGQCRPERAKRPKSLFSGLLKCGHCGSDYIIASRTSYSCSGYKSKGICDNKRMISISELERRILPALQSQLMKPEYYALFKSEYEKALKQLPIKQASEREIISKKLNAGQKSIDNLVDALMEAKGSAAIAKRLHELEAQQAERQQRFDALIPDKEPLIIPADLSERYKLSVKKLAATISKHPQHAIKEQIRSLIDEVRIYRPDTNDDDLGKTPLKLELIGSLVEILMLGLETQKAPELPGALRQLSLVAGAGFEPATFRL